MATLKPEDLFIEDEGVILDQLVIHHWLDEDGEERVHFTSSKGLSIFNLLGMLSMATLQAHDMMIHPEDYEDED